MRGFLTVFQFEFNKYAKRKSFVITTLLLAILIIGGLSFPRIQEAISNKTETTGEETPVANEDQKSIGIVNDAAYNDGELIALFETVFPEYSIDIVQATEEQAKSLVADETHEHVVWINKENSYTFITKSMGLYDPIAERIDYAMASNYTAYLLAQEGITGEVAQNILQPTIQSAVIETGKSQRDSYLYTYLLVFALYMAVLVYGQMVATSVASEKGSRAMEVLVTSVHPTKMIFGKVLGTGLVALIQLFAILGSGVFALQWNDAYWGGNDIIQSIFNIPLDTFLISFLLFIIGFFLYSFLYAAVGSLANRVEDVNTSLLPITFTMIATFMFIMISMNTGNVDTVAMKVLSYIPLSSPLALLVRFSMTDMVITEVILAVSVLVVTTAVIGYLSALVFRLGVLLYGNPPKIKNIVKLIKK